VKEAALVAVRLLCPNSKKFAHYARLVIVLGLTLALSLVPAAPSLYAAPAPAKARPQVPDDGESHACNLGPNIQHVIYIQFDNVHFRRDVPNVPSDLEQMPNLLNFLTDNGTLLSNHHTPLISHTADDIVTSLTGVYGDRHGIPVANSFGFFDPTYNPPTQPSFDGFSSSFTYWTDPVSTSPDTTPIMLAANGKNAPAPWVPYTRAGCNVGAASTANIELENTSSDLMKVFASDPTELAAALAEANSSDPFMQDKAVADFEGIAIHCARHSEVCSTENHGEPDMLPDEPGGYEGFRALYGHVFVAPVISPGHVLNDLDGNPITDNDPAPHTHIGFPGFDPTAAQSLAYVAAMQEHGVPVTFAYIADAHDNHPAQGDNAQGPTECKTDPEQGALGPGDECYVRQLQSYDEAFGKFFSRLAADGITKANTLFVITADENDHFAGGPPSPSTCDGSQGNFCSYSKLGEIDVNVGSLLAAQDPNLANAPYDIHFDMAPTFYLPGQPGPTDSTVREFERAAARITATSPITGKVDKLSKYLADPVEEKLLHMVTADPLRTPTFTLFGNPDYFFQSFGPPPVEDSAFAWNHGGTNPEIVTTWLGMVGPGVKNNGVSGEIWSDHTDIRPTMLLLTGLTDDYQHEGRALVETLDSAALPNAVTSSGEAFTDVARALKQINAPVGPLGLASLKISTRALAGDDETFSSLESKLSGFTTTRDSLAGQMLNLLEGAEFNGAPISSAAAKSLVQQANSLLSSVNSLAHGDD
jgi:hypothetical protein